MFKNYISVAVFMLFTLPGLHAQFVLKGKVIDAVTGVHLSGVNIMDQVHGRKLATDSLGRFLIRFVSQDHPTQLHFSKIGYGDKVVDINVFPTEEMTILLYGNVNEIAEVVVNTGYQKLGKERATGAFSYLDSTAIDYRPSLGVLDRLADQVPGLIFNNVGTKAINNNNILIRGQSTIESRTDPLIVIDDFPFDGDINSINPADVESITVLRDAAASSIWGARAGNGVIVISTKLGKYDAKPEIKLMSTWRYAEKPNLHYRQAIGNDTFIELEKSFYEAGVFDSRINSDSKEPLSAVVELLLQKKDYPDRWSEIDEQIEALKNQDLRSDLTKFVYRNPSLRQHALSLKGGSKRHRYYLSAGVDKNLEALRGNNLDRITMRFDNSIKLFKERIEINPIINYSFTNESHFNLPYQFSSMYPYAQVMQTNGEQNDMFLDVSERFNREALIQGAYNWSYRLMDELNMANNSQNLHNLNIGLRTKYDLKRGFTFSINYQNILAIGKGMNRQDLESYFTRNLLNQYSTIGGTGDLRSVIPVGGIMDVNHYHTAGYSLRPQLSFVGSRNLEGLSAIAGYEISENRVQNTGTRHYGYDNDHGIISPVDYWTAFTQFPNSNIRRQIPFMDRETESVDRFVSLYANAAYTWRNKVTISSSVRWDRSNLFGVKTNQKGVPLYSVGVSWNLMKEEFINPAMFEDLKLRMTVGKSGNVNRTLSAFTTARYASNPQANGLLYAQIVNPPNPQLRWEQTKMINLGVDFQIFKNSITGSIDVYKKRGIDIIGMTALPPQTGVISFKGNSANTQGTGIDVKITSTQMRGVFGWNTDLLYHFEQEKVLRYLQNVPPASTFVDGPGIPVVDFPLYSIYSYKWGGLDAQNGDPVGWLGEELSTDYARIFAETSHDQLKFHGSARPTHFGSVRNNFSYNNWSLSFTLNFKAGYYFRRESIDYNALLMGNGGHADYYQRWQNTGDESKTSVPSMPISNDVNRNSFYRYSDILVENGGHIRWQDIKLSHNFSAANTNSWMRSASIFCFVDNIGTLWTKNKLGIDPDVIPQINSFRSKIPVSLSLGIQLNL